MTPAEEYLKAIGWTGTEHDYYVSKGIIPPDPPPPKPKDYMGYWDPDYYLAQNPDVKAAGVDPMQHFSEFGWHENRNPSAKFDVSDYLDAYGDVKSANINPLEHFIDYGMKEYRNPMAIAPKDPVDNGGGGGTTTPPPVEPPPPPKPPTRGELETEARGGIRGYFMGKGANPDKYNQQIMDTIAARMAGITDEHLGDPMTDLFKGASEGLYDELTGQYRNTAKSAFDAANASYMNPYGTTFDDDLINTILSEQRQGANKFIDTALARGQTTASGADLARADLDRQQAEGSGKLNTFGESLISKGNTDFTNRQATRKNALGNIGLDAAYDTSGPDMDTLSNEFMLSLGKNLRKSPDSAGVIFNTAALPGIGSVPPAKMPNNTPYAGSPSGNRTPGGTYDPTKENVLF